MQLHITYGAQSMLNQLSSDDKQEALHTIDTVHSELNKNIPPSSVMERVVIGQTSDVYVARAGALWRVYFKVSNNELSVEDIVSVKQLEALRKRQSARVFLPAPSRESNISSQLAKRRG